MFQNSEQLYKRAKKYIPGGVNSPARAFKAVGGNPLFIDRAQGSRIYDVDGHEYIDYVGSWGPMILGHAYPPVMDAIRAQLLLGTSYGAPTEVEIEMAQMVIDTVPSIEMVRMVNSGTEAAMSAIRLARGYTGRDKIIKFQGCYHGHSDMLLAEAGSGVATLGIPGTPGVPAAQVQNTLTVPYNDLEAVAAVFEKFPEDVAVVALEPVAGNMGMVLPLPGFLEGLRELCDRYSALLLFDEVMSGFRVALGGAQEKLGVLPDLTCLGKIIGGGLPVGAYGGKKEIMQHVAPVGGVYQAGTLSGNPVAMEAGKVTLQALKNNPEFYQHLQAKCEFLTEGMQKQAQAHGVPFQTCVMGGMFGIFFSTTPVHTYADARACDLEAFKRFHYTLLSEGVYFPPSQFEAVFMSIAHDEAALMKTLSATEKAFAVLKS